MKKKKKAAPLKSRVQARALRTPSKGTPTKRKTSSRQRPATAGAASSARIAAAPPRRELYPPIEPFNHGYLRVSDVHELYYEECDAGGTFRGSSRALRGRAEVRRTAVDDRARA